MCPDWTGPRGDDSDDDSPPDRPYGTKPYGTKPYGTKPYGTKSDDPDFLDPDEWSEDVADLFCGTSAVVRLGARILADADGLSVAAVEPLVGAPQYMARPLATDPAKDKKPNPAKSEQKPHANVSERHLRPRDHELAVKIIVPNDLVRTLVEDPDVAWAVKQDLARALAFRADQAFLHGSGGASPLGIANTAAVVKLGHVAPAEDLLKVVRRMIGTLRRRAQEVHWGNAGWVLHPQTLDGLSRLLTPNFENQGVPGWPLEPGLVFTHDGNDGGVLFGYPFIVSAATEEPTATGRAGVTRIHFSSDWSEAWIGADRGLVSISVSLDAHFQTDETVIRAVMNHDFVLRRPRYFIYADRTPGSEQVQKVGGVDDEQKSPPKKSDAQGSPSKEKPDEEKATPKKH